MKARHEPSSPMARLFRGLLLLAICLTWLLFLGPTFMGGPVSYVIVSGASMEPTLYGGDLAVLRRREAYGLGDVVGFRVSSSVVIHRIVGGSAEDGYITQGDNKKGSDPWNPYPEDILGKMWLRVGRGGRVFALLRSPTSLAAVGAGMMLLMLPDANKKRRQRRARRQHAPGRSAARGVPGSQGMICLLGVLVVIGLGFVVGAIYSYRQPAQVTEPVERLRYEHTAAFNYTVLLYPTDLYPVDRLRYEHNTAYNYTVRARPSALYAGDVIGPIGAPSPGADSTVKTVPVATRLARALELDFAYLLAGPLPPDVQGELSAMLEIKAGENWAKTFELSPPEPFVGPGASSRIPVDFSQIISLTEIIGKQTGYLPTTHDISVIPTIRVWGRIGEVDINETYAPAFTMQLSRTQIRFDPEVGRREIKTVTEELTRVGDLTLAGLSIPVPAGRTLSVAGAGISLASAAALAASMFLRIRRHEPAQIQALYGSMLVSVAQADAEGARKIQVASMRDLARLAQRDGRIIFHQELIPDSHLYFINDGDAIYQYQVSERAEEG